MKDVIRRINLDLYTPKIYEIIRAQQGDIKTRYAEFVLFNQGNPYEIQSGITVKVEGVRGDNSGYVKTCTVESNIVSFELDKDLLYYDGIAKLKLVLYEGKKVLSSIPFSVSITRNPLFDMTFKKDDYSLVQDMLDRIVTLESEVDELEKHEPDSISIEELRAIFEE